MSAAAPQARRPPAPLSHTGTSAPSADPKARTRTHARAQASPPKPPGVKDVARLAGVSVGTVSNVLNAHSSVTPETREKVEQAVRELGYVRNPAARALRSGVSPMVGVAVLDIANPFFTEAAAGMERRLGRDGCVMLLSSTHADAEEEASLLRTLEGQGVRGILLTPTDSDLSVAQEIVERGTPVILFDSTATPAQMSSISVDDHAGAVLAVKHLLDLGHRHLAFLNGPRRVRQARDRAAGVAHACEEAAHDVDLQVVELPDFTAVEGRRATEALLAGAGLGARRRSAPPSPPASPSPPLRATFPTAIFCANDLIAFGALIALRDAGIRVPQDVSLVGFDDITIAAQTSVPLTTVRQPMAELGWAAADMLLNPSSGVRHEKFFPELVVRASTGEPRP